jgi:hypothetical protein
LIFFFQSLQIFAEQQGENAWHGATQLLNPDRLSRKRNDDGDDICRLMLTVHQSFYLSIFGVPLYLLAVSYLVFILQETRFTRPGR